MVARRWTAKFLFLLLGCGPDEDAFYGQVFPCDAKRPAAHCGTARTGGPMACFPNYQLGATDICVEQCDEVRDFSEDSDAICMKIGDGSKNNARLSTCRPSEGTPDDPDGCGPDLACYRTNLLADQGLCLAIRTCNADTDCSDPRSTCAGTLIKQFFPEARFQASNFQCIAAGCKDKPGKCPEGETCLPDEASKFGLYPDICVPTCESGYCPPNYYCWADLSGGGSPPICLPGVQGSRCRTSIDCLVGECVDIHHQFGQCGIPCEQHQDCLPYSGSGERMYCLETDSQSGARHCINPGPFEGAQCPLGINICTEGEMCFGWSPYHLQPTNPGSCRLPCGPNDECPVRGGVVHSCFIHGGEKSCFPGRLGVTCHHSGECLPGMSCHELALERRLTSPDAAPATETVCTLPCITGDDCDTLLGPHHEGYCEDGWCRLGGGLTQPCSETRQCRGELECVGAAPGVPGTCTLVRPPQR